MDKELYLEKFLRGDFDKYYELVSNGKVMAKITERAIPLNEAHANYKQLLSNNDLHPSFGTFKVIILPTQTFIGLAKLEVRESNAAEAEIGYMLLPAVWGKGLGGEVARHLVEKAKHEKQLQKLTAVIDPNNIPSRKILIRLGFVSEKVSEIDGLPAEEMSLNI